MANQTVSVDRNGDDAAISGLLNGEDYTINSGATLTINSDSRWGQQAAVVGNINIDAATGGTVRIDARNVWWVPYDGGTGTVPALGTVGTLDVSRGGTGVAEFLGVFTALGVAPTAAASAMPATGFIKLRRTTATLADNDVLTFSNGATVTVNSATGGRRGWLHIVGEEQQTITVPRLGRFEALGDWFELGTATGATGETFQYYVADICPAVQVETAAGSGVYEWWGNAGATRWGQNNRVAQDSRGKYFNCSAAGVITFALRGAVNNGSTLPAGARVRVPNIHVSNSTTANWNANLISTTIANRWEFATTSAGDIRIDGTNGNWYINLSQPFAVNISRSATLDTILVAECPTNVIINDCAVGLSAAIDLPPLQLSSNFAGNTITGGFYTKYEGETGDVGATLTDCADIAIAGARFDQFGDNTAATLTRGAGGLGALQLLRCSNFHLENLVVVGGSLRLVSSSDGVVRNTRYADSVENPATTTTNGVSGVDLSGACADIQIDGFNTLAGATNVHPYNGCVTITASYRCTVENIGSFSVPYNGGSANRTGVLVILNGNGSDHIIRRCYGQNLRTGAISTLNSDTDVQIIDVRGDYAASLTLNTLNCLARGLAATNGTTGATAVYGTHFWDMFTAATTGRIVFCGNEPTSFSGSRLQTTAGAATYTSTGNVMLVNVGDQVTWEMDYFALGHTGFTATAPVITGTNTGNHTIEFQWDTGSGFNGSWLLLTAANLQAIGAIDPAVGVRLRVRATCSVASASNALTFIRVETSSSSAAQQNQYPLPGVPLTLTGLVSGSEVRVYVGTDPATSVELAGVESSTSTFSTSHTNTGQEGYIVVFATGYQTVRIPITFSSSAVSIPIQQTIDRVFENA